MLLSTPQLSVILPTSSSRIGFFQNLPGRGKTTKALVERAVQSILDQPDPIGTEIVVVDDEHRHDVADHLESVFAEAYSQRRLNTLRVDRYRDMGRSRNLGAEAARGLFLNFLDPCNYWAAGRLQEIQEQLSRNDLVVGLAPDPQSPISRPFDLHHDWIQKFLQRNPIQVGSVLYRRSFFDQVGPFSEGYHGTPLPRRLPGQLEYEHVLQSMAILVRTSRKDRLTVVQNQHLIFEKIPRSRAQQKKVELSELLSIARSFRKFPKRYWPAAIQRILGNPRWVRRTLEKSFQLPERWPFKTGKKIWPTKPRS